MPLNKDRSKIHGRRDIAPYGLKGALNEQAISTAVEIAAAQDRDERVRINDIDTTAAHLWDKVTGGDLISLSIDGTTSLKLKIDALPFYDEKFKVSAEDNTTNYGNEKIITDGIITKEIINPGGDEQLKFSLDAEQLKAITQRAWEQPDEFYLDSVGGDDTDWIIKRDDFEVSGVEFNKNMHYRVAFDDGNPRCCGRLIGIGATDEIGEGEIDWEAQRGRMVLITALKLNDNSTCWFNILANQIVGAHQFKIALDHGEQIYHLIKALFIIDVDNECWHLVGYERMKTWIKRVPATDWVGISGVGEPPVYEYYRIPNLPFPGYYKVKVYIYKGGAEWYLAGAYYILHIDDKIVCIKREIEYSFISGTGHTSTGDHYHDVIIDSLELGFEPTIYDLEGTDLSLEKTTSLCADRHIKIQVVRGITPTFLNFDLDLSYAIVEYKGKTLGHDCWD